MLDRLTLRSGPNSVVANATSATFTFDSLYDAATSCKLDHVGDFGGITACSSPFTYNDLTEGAHRVAFIEAGFPADPSGVVVNWTIDLSGPLAFNLRDPADGATGVGAVPTFSWDDTSDAPAGVEGYELWLDGAKAADVPLSACSGGVCTTTAPAAIADGDHTWEIHAIDTVGNSSASASRKFSVAVAPTAALTITPNPALVGRQVTFNASGSIDNGTIQRYEWDLDGDGKYELDTGTTATTIRTFDIPATYQASVRVTDGIGLTSTAGQALKVSAAAGETQQIGVTIKNGAQYTNKPDVTLGVRSPLSADTLLISNDGGFLAAQRFAPKAEIPWRLDSSGPERLPKTVYLRFLAGPVASPNYTDDIILDERPPTVQSASIVPSPGAASAARAAALRIWKVKVKASDTNSGVGWVQVTINKRKPGKLIAYRSRLKVKSATRPRWLRARDRAGNNSRWRKLG